MHKKREKSVLHLGPRRFVWKSRSRKICRSAWLRAGCQASALTAGLRATRATASSCEANERMRGGGWRTNTRIRSIYVLRWFHSPSDLPNWPSSRPKLPPNLQIIQAARKLRKSPEYIFSPTVLCRPHPIYSLDK